VLTDNGAIFTGQPRRGGRTALEITLGALGINYRRSRPYHLVPVAPPAIGTCLVGRWCDVPEQNLVGDVLRRVTAGNVHLLRVAPRGAVIPAVALMVLQNGNLLGVSWSARSRQVRAVSSGVGGVTISFGVGRVKTRRPRR
jgi:hypothetical protein